MNFERSAAIVLVALLLLGFGLRLIRLNDAPLRGDEAFSAMYWAGLPLQESLTQIATIEPHPVLTYVLFRAWGLLTGIEEPFALRLLPALLNLLGIAAIYQVGNLLGDSKKLGILAALLWAIQPFQIWHSQDFRNYAPWAGMSALSFALALRLIRYQRRRDWVNYTLIATLTSLLFYMEVLSLLVLSAYVLAVCRKNRSFLSRWCLAVTIAGGSAALSFLVLQGSLFARGGYGGTSLTFELNSLFSGFLPSLSFGETYDPAFISGLWPVLLCALAASLWLTRRQNPQRALLLGLWMIVPLILLSLVATRMNVFLPRYVMFSAPAYALTFLSGMLELSRLRPAGRWLASAAIGGWLVISGAGLVEYYTGVIEDKAPDWPTLTTYLQQNVTENSLVIQTSLDAAFGYYYSGIAPDVAVPASPRQTPDEIIAQMEQFATHHDSIWIVGRTLPDWPNAGIVERWAQTAMQETRRFISSGLPAHEYRRWEVSDNEVAIAPLGVLGGIVRIESVQIWHPFPGEDLTVWVYWQSIQPSEAPLKFFVHLVGEINPATGSPLWSQDDHPPALGDTTTRIEGRIYREVFYLPLSEVAPGTYTLHLGLYEPESGMRLLTQAGQDHIVIARSLRLP